MYGLNMVQQLKFRIFKFSSQILIAQSWASRREYANTWGDYTDIFNDLLYTFLTEFDRKMTRRIIFKNMKFNDFDGLHVSSSTALLFQSVEHPRNLLVLGFGGSYAAL